MGNGMSWKEEEVEFTAWANGGAALGKLSDGRIVFVKGILPGEKARIRYADREARFISAELVKLLSRSDRKSTRLNSSHPTTSRMPSSA